MIFNIHGFFSDQKVANSLSQRDIRIDYTH